MQGGGECLSLNFTGILRALSLVVHVALMVCYDAGHRVVRATLLYRFGEMHGTVLLY